MRRLFGIINSINISLSKLQGSLACCSLWSHKDSHTPGTEQQQRYSGIVKSRKRSERGKKNGGERRERKGERKDLSRVVEKDTYASIQKSEFFVLEGIF